MTLAEYFHVYKNYVVYVVKFDRITYNLINLYLESKC